MAYRFSRSVLIAAAVTTGGLAAAQSVAVPYGTVSVPGAYGQGPSSSDSQGLLTALAAARAGDSARARVAMQGLYDPLARKLALWALSDAAVASMSFADADNARLQLTGWPRAARRQITAEGLLDQSGLSPSGVIAWFAGAAPLTGHGTLSLANALRATGQGQAAAETARAAWRLLQLDSATESALLSAYGVAFTALDMAAHEGLERRAAAERGWRHGATVTDALRLGDSAGAYAAAANAGFTSGVAAAEAEFLAGWIALTRLKDAHRADDHFVRLQAAGTSPLTQSRALFWRGRAAEAAGDPVAAQLFYDQGAHFYTTFYGQLSALRAGAPTMVLGRDPAIGVADRAAFEGREPVRALRLLAGIGARDTFKSLAAELSDVLTTAQDEALLVDLTRGYGDQEVSMRVVRNAAKRGFILPERGYPLRTPPRSLDAPEPALVLGITRQESSFDPHARSGAGARGMMQLMPGTAQGVARRLGMDYSSEELDDPDYNMRLGSAYLGQLVDEFSGSYVMAAAAYNAGPGRPNQWAAQCGDPRAGGADPLDFIECIPFGETRDYVMRVLEATQVYRARLAGGQAPITLANDLRRGAYGYRTAGPPLPAPPTY